MKRIILLVLFLSLLFHDGFSQQKELPTPENKASNAITLGAIGEGNMLSLNYSRKILQRPKFFIDAKVGIGFISFGASILGGNTELDLGLSHTISFNYGGKGH